MEESEYLKYLPTRFQQKEIDDQSNFLRDFSKIFEKILSGRDDPAPKPELKELKDIRGIEEILDNIHDYFDLLYAPQKFIQWLSGWIALTINEDWSDAKKRRLRTEVVSLYKIRGTLKSLERFLGIYTTDVGRVKVREVEDFQIGDKAGDQVQTKIGENTRIGSTSPYFFEVFISLPDPDPFILDFKRREVISIIDLEKPAYTYYGLRLQVGTMQIGSDTLHSVHFVDENTGWAVGAGGILLYTADGGSSWVRQVSFVTDNLYAVSFHDNLKGWAVGAGGIILHTSDGGESWQQQTSGINTSLFAVDFHDDSNGWAAGQEGVILHTTDGGVSWNIQSSGITENIFGLSFPTALRGWVAGEGGLILRTTNSGMTWNPQSSGIDDIILGVYFRNTLRGWGVGEGGLILATTNGGANWNTQNSGVATSLNAVFFRNNNRGWAVGSNGVILFTNDGGANWTAQSSGVNEDLIDLCFLTATSGWVTGKGGVFLFTTNTGTTWTASRSAERSGHSTIGTDTLLGTLI